MTEQSKLTQAATLKSLLCMPLEMMGFGLSALLGRDGNELDFLSRLRAFFLVAVLLPLILVGILALLPLLLVLQLISYAWMFYTFDGARFTDEGVVVFSRRRGVSAVLKWQQVVSMQRISDPPGFSWEILLDSGATKEFWLVDETALMAACEAHRIPVLRERGIGRAN